MLRIVLEAIALGLVVLAGVAVTGHLYGPLDYVFPFVLAAFWFAGRVFLRSRRSATTQRS